MSTASEVRIGDRIRFYRQAQSKTQVVVAGLAGVTEDYLSQIERGLKTPTIGLVHKFARILRVRVADLLGEPEPERDGGEHPIGRAVSAALLSYGIPRPSGAADEIDKVDASGLRPRVDHAWSMWQTAPRRYSELSRAIPKLVVDVEQTRRSVAETGSVVERRVLHRIAADLYFLLRSFTRRIGRPDLSILVADRAIAAAEHAGDPLRIATAQWNLAHVLLAQGEDEGAVEVTANAAEAVGRARGVDAGDAAAIQGALSLVQAIATVRGGDAWSARDIIRERAWPMARRTGEGNVMWTVFGPTNVRLHAVSIEMETGHTAEALRLADQIDVNGVDSLERRTTFALEVARCYEQKRDDAAVLVHLVIAEGTGPEDLRYNPLARDLVHGLLKRARPTYAPQVRGFADRLGLLA